MENQNLNASQQEAVQGNLENQKGKNFFFEHVKEVINKKRNDNTFEKELDNVLKTVKENNPLSVEQFELLGILCFLLGVDYTGMAFPQKKILENVSKRYEEVEITTENLEVFKNILNELKDKDLHNIIDSAISYSKDKIQKEIEVSNDNKVALKLIKSKLNKFLETSIIPIQFSKGAVELKRNNLTWENLLKFNSLLNEQAIYTGQSVKKFIEVYSDNLFNSLLKQAGDIFNQTKFAIIYEESIVAAVETLARFAPVFNADLFTDEQYDEMRIKYAEEIEAKQKEAENNVDEYKPLQYTGEQVKQLMSEAPDEFVVLNLMESGRKNVLNNVDDLIDCINETAKNTDFVQHIYQYLHANLNSNNRVKGVTALTLDINSVIETLNNHIKKLGEEYKTLAEINCSEIPEEQYERIINMVNDTIKACYLETQDQKQYLISQLVENGIKTWNHLQQILSVVETCNIIGSECDTYANLVNYITEKSNITEVFDNAQKLNEIQLSMSLFTAYRNWFKFHTLVIEDNNEEKA